MGWQIYQFLSCSPALVGVLHQQVFEAPNVIVVAAVLQYIPPLMAFFTNKQFEARKRDASRDGALARYNFVPKIGYRAKEVVGEEHQRRRGPIRGKKGPIQSVNLRQKYLYTISLMCGDN